MNLRSLEEIKRLRKKYNLTQSQLAKQSGVSQSLITKIESGKLDPTFSKAKLIFNTLELQREKEEIKAKQIMSSRIIFSDNNDLVKDLVKVMKIKGISQVPVLKDGKVCGLITESIILQNLTTNPEKLAFLTVEKIMEDSPPIISQNTNFKVLSNLLSHSPLLLIAEKGEIKGVITKADLLDRIE